MNSATQPLMQNLNATQVVGGPAKKSNNKMIMWIVIGAIVIGILLGFAFRGDGFWYGVGGKKSIDDGGDDDGGDDVTCADNQEKNDDGDCICVDGFSFDDDGTTCVLDGIDIIGVWDKGKQYGGTGIKISQDDFLPYKGGGKIAMNKTVVISNGTNSATMTIASSQTGFGKDDGYQFIYFTESKFNGISVDVEDPTSIKLVVG